VPFLPVAETSRLSLNQSDIAPSQSLHVLPDIMGDFDAELLPTAFITVTIPVNESQKQ
jgi:hypothetical protein